MTVALLYPPLCDPTAPYVSVPLLAAVLRRAGLDVLAVDANAEAVAWLLQRDVLEGFAARVRERLAELDARPSLDLQGQRDLARLAGAWGPAAWAPAAAADAVATLRDPVRFFDPAAYDRAVATVDAALEVATAACAPLQADFASWRTPFALLSPDEIRADAGPDRDPFHAFYRGPLADRLRAARPGLVGVSVAFPGQVQPAFALALALREAMPGVPLVAGGPAISQILSRLPADRVAAALGPFDAAVVGEGEDALVRMAREAEAGGRPRGLVQGGAGRDLADLPAPDLAGLWPGAYLSPEPVIPYDAARGCYWGRCAFCHYGPVASGTAPYRERPAALAAAHLRDLCGRWGGHVAYLSEDTLSPRGARALGRALREAGGGVRWATDLRPEPALATAVAAELAGDGLLAASLGVESACPRVLARIDKGVGVAQVEAATRALAAAGVAVEAMAFTGFPGETGREAMETVRWLSRLRESLALFICGEFALTHGSKVAADPAAYGVAESWEMGGDWLRTAIFWRGRGGGPGPAVDRAVEGLSRGWALRRYPWAGSLSTAHTLLWYDRHGPGVFRDLAGRKGWRFRAPEVVPPRLRYDPAALAEVAAEAEAAIWDDLVNGRRAVSRRAWEAAAKRVPRVRRGGRA